MSGLFLGESVDPATHQRSGTNVELDPASFTTHGVIVGQTGSGKTGLGLVLIEEALLSGVPVILVDPKGDLANLALTFPGLSGPEFAPWIESGDAGAAEAIAKQWADGLASWGLDGTRIAALKAAAEVAVYTPGSSDDAVARNAKGFQSQKDRWKFGDCEPPRSVRQKFCQVLVLHEP